MSDLIDRTRFHSLTADERQTWEARLRAQFDVPLQDTVQFYVEGPDIVGVVRYKRDESGRFVIHDGMRPEYAILGVVSNQCPTCGRDNS